MTETPGRKENPPATTADAHISLRLRGLAEDAEQLVRLSARPSVVRMRARRCRTRRRAGAATFVGGAALAIAAAWGMLPYVQDSTEGPATDRQARDLVSAAALLPPAQPDGKLTEKALLSPSALPWNGTYRWRSTGTGRGTTPALPRTGKGGCHVQWFEDLSTTSTVTQTYDGQGPATAQHRIAAFAVPSDAAQAAATLGSRLRGCGWHETRATEARSSGQDASSGATPAGLHEYVLTSGRDGSLRVTLAQSDNRVAVLAVSTPVAYNHAHPDSRTDACLNESLRGTATSQGSEEC
ncbi:hypothetical protein ACWDYK_01530 [Streptomyces anthocyanicus]|uniref:Uncharacterized protein n=1 Tax=Streptomyces lividans 1326 TaxID=1200984 RepID=A0A7U9DQ84_STRLI|nr:MULTISPECIES: hypothetical protein [Streptomyces]EOY45757.1 hypothetical protein SLI_1040 [Streptomyces lividans 1326]KKD12296.1 hypothetical protein TR66_26800 [Streptomyces sp. WM6391]